MQWLKSSRDSSTMDIDQTPHEAPVRPAVRPAVSSISEEGASPFDATHPYLRQTLQEIETATPPLIQEFPAYMPRQPKPTSSSRLEPVEQPEGLGCMPDVARDMLEFALGQNEDLVAATLRHSADPSTPACTATQRVGNHTFNFDFGALASNVNNQNNTYMSWF
jgi:hypothetical protein